MSAFKALNIESDNESEDEIDNTKEIQIEEALKLYQTALKFHSEGPQSFDKAAEAYKALFESEIFKYAESLSEYRRHELYGDNLEYDNILQDDFEPGPVQLVGGPESAPNTLPQILHLSYKNHGQFLLEMMQYHLQQHETLSHVSPHILASLQYFAEALDKDDADLDLWTRTSSVAALLGSRRITRFCLEAVLDGDDELLDSILRLPGLEEGFAGQQLRELTEKLQDDLSLMQAPLSSTRRKKLSVALKKRLNPYSFAPLPSDISRTSSIEPLIGRQPGRLALNPAKRDWAGVGEAVLHQYMTEQGGFIDLGPAPGITITLPPAGPDEDDIIQEDVSPTGSTIEVIPITNGSTQLLSGSNHHSSAEGERMSIQDNDVAMQDQIRESAEKNENGDPGASSEAPVPQSRKRSTESAGLPETADGGRVRSKRIRARETVVDGAAGVDTTASDLAKQMEDQLSTFVLADQYLFEIINDLLAKLDVQGLGNPKTLRDAVTTTGPLTTADESPLQAARDLFTAVQSGGSKTAAVLLSGETVDLGGMSREAGLNAFLGYAKSGISQSCTKPTLGAEKLNKFLQIINHGWLSVQEVAFTWLQFLLLPGSLPVPKSSQNSRQSSYMHYRWAEDLKRHVVQIIVNLDEFIYQQLLDRVSELNSRMLEAQSQCRVYEFQKWDHAQVEMVETLFELHLDIYSLIKHPNSGVDSVTQTLQNDRLERWAALARDMMQLRSNVDEDVDLDELALRHIWASIFHLSVCEDVPQEHIIYSMEELKTIFKSIGEPTIEVQNNAVMPELSIAAVDRELARISMKDFFLRIFDQDEKDPVAVIESLEPILESSKDFQVDGEVDRPGSSGHQEQDGSDSPATLNGQSADEQHDPTQPSRSSPIQEMKKFLDTANVSLRLSLWQRLREAYEAIEYPPKVVSCYLRSIETLVKEFNSRTYRDAQEPDRQYMLLSRFRIIDELLVKTLQIVKSDTTAFDCLAFEHLQTSMSAISSYLQILNAVNIFEDMTRVGQCPLPRYEGCPNGTFLAITGKLHDLQLRAWILQYFLFKEGIKQNAEAFPSAADDKFEYLRHVHYATGIRGFGHAASRMFLRLEKDELIQLDDVTDSSTRDIEFAQVLYDLYGLKTFINSVECLEFASNHEILDKKTASQLLPFIMSQAQKINIKDLPKTELKVTIDKVHGALGRPKATEDMSQNRKLLTAYFKAPINPISLFRCLQGIGSLSTKYIPPQGAIAASKGWYFLMGNIALNKFRSQKRTGQGPIEDINIAAAFFVQDLEYTIDRWETWYRLAQTHDSQLEEAVSWTAEKLNSNSAELLHFQRSAIHCYSMAVACAVCEADPSPQTVAKVSEMYSDFGNRVYSSSRQPFNMLAFSLRETEQKYYTGHTIFQGAPFAPLREYTAWKLASVLFKRAIAGNPEKWWNYYMLGKCLWKMHCADEGTRGNSQPPSWENVIDAFGYALDMLPEKKDNRGREPILEPHYKLVSIGHKLVQSKAINYVQGGDLLQHTGYAQNITFPENSDDWERFVLAVLKALRSADKSGWHHRMTARTAHIVYDDSQEFITATAAKQELTQQMFTKTMAVQVWKPENERPGRHFVYTSRYTSFFVKLLVQTGDRASLEALAKRVRKKPHEFFEHAKLWQELCLAYLKLLRRVGKIPEGHEDAVFKSSSHEEFQGRSALVEAWCQLPTTQHPILDVLRDVIELKRLNNGLMKALLIDDLIGDTYAMLYATIAPTLEPSAPQPGQLQQAPIQHQLAIAPQPQPAGAGPMQQPTNPMAFSSLMHLDGTTDVQHNHQPPQNFFHPDQQRMPPNDATSRSRVKGVGRRELQRKAEAAVMKPAAPAPAIPIRSPPIGTHPQVVIPSRPATEQPPSASEHRDPSASGPEGQLQIPGNFGVAAPSSTGNIESSAPGSMHDSADDESELSELDEQEVEEIQDSQEADEEKQETVVVKPLFPNLTAHKKEMEKGEESVGASSAATPEAGGADA